MYITIKSKNTNVTKNLLWVLEHFENDGVKIIGISDNNEGLSKLFKEYEECTDNNESNVLTSTEVKDENKTNNESSESTARKELETKLTELITKNRGKFSSRISYETFLKNIKTNELEALIEIIEFIVNRKYSFMIHTDGCNTLSDLTIRLFDVYDALNTKEITFQLYRLSADILAKHNVKEFYIEYYVHR